MKILCVVLALLSIGAVSGAQEAPPRMKIGSTWVSLGMSRTQLRAKLSAGQTLVGDTDDEKSLGLISLGKEIEGEVWFRKGILIAAERNWLVGGVDGVAAVIGAIDSLTQEGFRDCAISHYTTSDPLMHFEVANIQCGSRWLTIRKGQIEKTRNFEGGEDEGIIESIGSI